MALLGLYTFFYLVMELAVNDYAEPVVGCDAVTTLYGCCHLAVAAGFLLYPLLLRYVHREFAQRAVTAAAAALAGAAFLAVSFTSSQVWLAACALFCHLASGVLGGAVYAYTAMKLKNWNRIGLTIAIAYAGANAVQAIGLFSLTFLSVPVGRWIERVALVAALVVLAWAAAVRVPARAQPEAEPGGIAPNIRKYILGALAAMALIALLYGINDGVVTFLHANSGGYLEGEFVAYGYPRLLAIPGLLVAGAVADLKDRRYFPYATLLSMIVMTVAILLFSSPETYDIALCFIYFFCAFMSLYSIVPFMEWAPSTKRPALVAVAGRGVRYACSGMAIMASGALFASASMVVILALYVLLLALLFTVFFFMGQLRLPAPVQEERQHTFHAFAQAYALTEREAEILNMLSCGRSTAEVAADLYISDKTVRNHVGNMLAKTGTHSRTELLLLARKAMDSRDTGHIRQ